MPVYLDFEEPLKELQDQLDKARELNEKENVNVKDIVKGLEKKIIETRKKLYSKLTPWQRVQVSRHPERPYSLSYIQHITDGDFIELHGIEM